MKSLSVLFSIGMVFVASHTVAKEVNNLNLFIQGEPELTLDLIEFVLKNPEIHLPESGTEYHIRLVEPDPSIDYQILNIEVDPDVDYKLHLINPESVNEGESVYDEFVKELKRKFKREQNSDNE